MESDSPNDPTLCLDLYCEGHAPGFGPKGVQEEPPMVVLYRVAKNKLNHIWLCDDEDRLAANANTSAAGLKVPSSPGCASMYTCSHGCALA